jgi:hypothetical protein
MVKLGKKRAPASLLSKMIQHLYNPLKLEKIEKRAIMKFKALEGSEKILGKVGNKLKIGGKGVGILDTLFLGLDLKDVWTNEDKNISDKLYDSGKKISGAVGGFLGGDAGFTAGLGFGTFLSGPIIGIIVGLLELLLVNFLEILLEKNIMKILHLKFTILFNFFLEI